MHVMTSRRTDDADVDVALLVKVCGLWVVARCDVDEVFCLRVVPRSIRV